MPAGWPATFRTTPRSEGIVRETERRFGTPDILVNNAGVIEPIGPIAESDPGVWRRNIEINLIGAYNAVRAILPKMIAAGHGTLINVSSGAAHRPLEGWGAYCSAKAGLAMLTTVIMLETAGSGVRVFGLSPGVIDTDMQGRIRSSGINRISRIPARRTGAGRSSGGGDPPTFAPMPPTIWSAAKCRCSIRSFAAASALLMARRSTGLCLFDVI